MKLSNLKKGMRILPINLSWGLNKPMMGPMICTIFITKKCNSKCTMCDDWKTPKETINQELTTEEIKALIRDLKTMKTKLLNISGGEPLCRQDLFEIMDYAIERGIEVKISTNAMLISKTIAEKLAKRLDFVSVSLDASTPELHDSIRGIKNAFKLAINGIKNLAEARDKYNKKLIVTISTTISKKNVNDLPDLVKFSEKLGINHISFNPIQSWVFLSEKERDKLLPTPEEMKKTAEILKKMKKDGRRIRNTSFYLDLCVDYMKDPKIYPLNCKILYINTYIDAIGNVHSCPTTRTTVGNIRDKKLSEIWHSKIYNKKRAAVKNKMCERCWWTCASEVSLLYSPSKVLKVAKEALKYFK